MAMADVEKIQDDQDMQLSILHSLADIYYSMHLIDLVNNSAIEYEAKNQVKAVMANNSEASAAEIMNKVMHATMEDAYLDIGLQFSNVLTLQARMTNKKFISMDLHGKNVGWIRMMFITIKKDEKGVPLLVLCTTQIVEEEKKREEELYKEANVDELTGCNNRRAYEDDILNYPDVPTEEDFVYMAMDINELKVTNDTLGHEAGDELILGAVACMKQCIGNYGKIYRIGGDEFVAMIFANPQTLQAIDADFQETMDRWQGKEVQGVSVSFGHVTKREFPTLKVVEMAKIADQRMYEAKAHYYQSKGVDRRGQAAAHTALCKLYTKILKINLTKDSYQIVNMDAAEQTKEKGFAPTISMWLSGFGKSGQVHTEDLENYLEKTDLQYLKEYFATGKNSITIMYRRKAEKGYNQAVMEMIPADDYTAENQSLYLYVKETEIQ